MQSQQPSGAAETVALEYLRQLEAGAEPVLADYERRLDNETDRAVLRELIAAARWARTRYPAPFRAEVLIDTRYRLIRQIGAGGYGKVWLAEDTRLARDVALKLVTAFGDAEAAAKSIRHEVATLSRLSHRGIVRLYDSGTHEGCCYVAMEFVAGKSLAELIDLLPLGGADSKAVRQALDCPVPAGETAQFSDDWQRFAAGVVQEILWALSAAHGNGVVHRDLKPANVMLTGGGRPILLDFGLAGLRDRESGTITKGLFGTTPYLAPEQLAAERSGKAPAIDVYQTGLILYELLTGKRAFAASLQEGLVHKVLEGEFDKPRRLRPELPQALEDIVLRAMARSPAQRYIGVDAFRTDLERWLEGTQPMASAGGVAMRVVRQVRTVAFRRRRILALAAALVLGALPVYLLRPEPSALHNLVYHPDEKVSFDVASATGVIALGVWVDANDKTVAFQSAIIRDGDKELPVVELGPGSHQLQLAAPLLPPVRPADAVLKIRVIGTDDPQEAAAWHRFQILALNEIVKLGRPLDHAEMATHWRASMARGGDHYEIDRLIGNGTGAWFGREAP